MATRYWRGGSGTWNTSSTTNWSTTSGGAGGASAPTSADDVIIDANSGSGSISASSGVCKSISVASGAPITNITGSFEVWSGNATFSNTGSLAISTVYIKGTGGGTLSCSSTTSINALYISLSSGSYSGGTVRLSSSCFLEGGTFNVTTLTYLSGGYLFRGAGGNASVTTFDASATTVGVTVDTAGVSTISIGTATKINALSAANSGSSVSVTSSVSFASNTTVYLAASSGASISFPGSWPTSAQVLALYVGRGSTGSITPSVPSTFNNYGTLTLSGAGISVSSATGVGSLTVRNGATVSTASASSSATVELDGYIGSLSLSGSSLTVSSYTSSSTTAIGSLTKSSGTNLTVYGSGTQGRVGTFTYQVSGSTLTLDSAMSTFNVNTLNLGPASGSMIVTSSTPTTTRAKIAANSSYLLRNIEWRGIDADGVVPFTGTNFVDGGNNIDISFPGRGSGLFFGSNF